MLGFQLTVISKYSRLVCVGDRKLSCKRQKYIRGDIKGSTFAKALRDYRRAASSLKNIIIVKTVLCGPYLGTHFYTSESLATPYMAALRSTEPNPIKAATPRATPSEY